VLHVESVGALSARALLFGEPNVFFGVFGELGDRRDQDLADIGAGLSSIIGRLISLPSSKPVCSTR
jgi:hypothetical protein